MPTDLNGLIKSGNRKAKRVGEKLKNKQNEKNKITNANYSSGIYSFDIIDILYDD